jgi:hypothetical protein
MAGHTRPQDAGFRGFESEKHSAAGCAVGSLHDGDKRADNIRGGFRVIAFGYW